MKESYFYKVLDQTEEMGDVTEGHFPTVETLEKVKAKEHIEEFLPYLAYISSDPAARNFPEKKDDPEYRKSVEYCRNLLNSDLVKLEEE